jgi:CDP-paratose 2-epimerase
MNRLDKSRDTLNVATPSVRRGDRPVLITGGSGFIGCNLADSFLAEGTEVIVLDNLSRPGVRQNLNWLIDRHGALVHPHLADVRNPAEIGAAIAEARAVYHFAAQTAVTTSLVDPVEDFEVNARGTLNVLEAVRRTGRPMPVIFSSTNKVYGGLEDIALTEGAERYAPADAAIAGRGVSEARPLDFCTPYGCSKGVADQYVLDAAKSYGLPTAVLRMSCIYGPRQFGTEDQGWVAHFLIRALAGEPITLYGDGKQVRDILHVRDAVAAYRAVLADIDRLAGQAFNLGGGPANAVSLKLLLAEIAAITGAQVDILGGDWRQGDQLYFVADTGKLRDAVGWQATVGWRDGVRDLARWLREERRAPADAQSARRVTA